MGTDTKIEWCHHTLNVWRGCSKVHAGCTNCYAEKNIGVKLHGIQWGEVWAGGQRVIAADSAWKHPFTWARAAAKAGERRRVFCSSLADVLEVPEYPPFQHLTTERRERVNEARRAMDVARARLWDVIRQTANLDRRGVKCQLPETHVGHADWCNFGLDWLILTKRPENWELVPEDVRPLVWLGTSVSDQKTADEWVPRLLSARGFRRRFLSLEPMVGAVDLRDLPANVPTMEGGSCPVDYFDALTGEGIEAQTGERTGRILPSLDWVIIGGESGSKSRPCNVEWVRGVVRQCREASVPCFVKQLGAAPVTSLEPTGNFRTSPETGRRQLEMVAAPLSLKDSKGGIMDEWPEDIRVREVPGHG